MIKKFICILLVLALLLSVGITVYAEGTGSGEGGSDPYSIDTFKDQPGIEKVDTNIQSVSIKIITAVRYIAVTIALATLLVIAMKYMVSSAGDRADIKKHAVAYVTGVVILFGVAGILSMIEQIAGLVGEEAGEPTE